MSTSSSTNYDKQRTAAEAYLKAKQIPELLSYLMELLTYAKPENPRAYLLEAITKMKDKKPEYLFADDELTTMFEMIDVTKSKFITVQQLKNAYANLGDGEQLDEKKQLTADVVSSGKVNLECFKKVIGDRLRTKNVWS